MSRAFTTKQIDHLKPNPSKRLELPDPGLSGLYLIVQPSGAKSWALRYRHLGRPRKLTLGRWPVVNIKAARIAASEALETAAQGRDPGQELKSAKAARALQADRDTVEALFESYAARHLSKLKSGHTAKREIERHAIATWVGRSIHDITKRDVIDLLDGIVDTGRAVSANRVRAYLSGFFNWCLHRGVIEASPLIGVRPPTKEQSRDRVLTDDEIRWFWQASERVGQPWGQVGKLLLLTGQRLREVAGMTDSEIQGDVWHLTSDRTKNGRAHDVHLSDVALTALASVDRISGHLGYIHTTTGETPVSGFTKARNSIAKHMSEIAESERGEPVEIPNWGFHDLRRTAATGMARLGIPVRVTEAVLNHVSGTGGGIVAIYQRHDYAAEKKAALDAWARFVLSLLDGENENVVLLGNGR